MKTREQPWLVFGTVASRPAKSLTVHPLAQKIPMPAIDSPEREALRNSIEVRGILQPLIITKRDEIVAGRMRFEDGCKVGMTDFPCVECPDEDVAAIIVETLVARAHYTKGARAYLLAHLLEEAAQANKDARANHLLAGKSLRNPTELGFGKTEADFAEQFGFSSELIRQAKQVHVQFRKADKARAAWREKYPDQRGWQQAHDAGKKTEPLPDFVDAYPADLRAEYEPKILAGDLGLGAVIQAIAGKLSTEGQAKENGKPARLLEQAIETLQLRFSYWDKMPGHEREGLSCKWPGFVKALPPSEREILAKLLMEQL